jgi:hypothetical protein
MLTLLFDIYHTKTDDKQYLTGIHCKITVERCDVFLVGVPQIFDRVKSVALLSAKKKNKYKDHKGLRFRIHCLYTYITV